MIASLLAAAGLAVPIPNPLGPDGTAYLGVFGGLVALRDR